MPIDLAVVAPDPRFGGGGAAQTNAFLHAARALGRAPELVYAPHPVLAGRRFSIDRIEAVRHARAGPRLASSLRSARSAWVVSTIATAGSPAPGSGRPYACWLGTSLNDEWRGRRGGLGPVRRGAFSASLPALRAIERRVLRRAARLYATGRGSRDALADAGGIDARSIGILPIPVDLERFTPEADDVWAARLECPVLVFVGRASDPRKNVGLLLDALPALRKQYPSLTARLVGEPPRAPLPAGAEVIGVVPSVPEHLRTATLFVLPSRQEGFGIVAAEALAAGVPVVSTRSGGPEELIERSHGGRLLETFDPAELTAVVSELLGDADTLIAMRTAGRAYVAREHSPARLRDGLATALAELD